MIVKTRIFELRNGEYRNLADMAQAMGISVSQVYRVREGSRHINQKFIVGAIKAFPEHRFDDLFYFVPELPTVTENRLPEDSALNPSVFSVSH
ncbi:helix-turn-helix domain-containing protein [Chloroflexota bacterium]